MADDLYHASRSDNKRKFDDHGGAATPSLSAPASFPRTASLSTPIISPTSVAAAAPSYNSVPPPLDGIELAKRRAQEIAARIFSDAEAKRPKVDSGSGVDDSSNRSFGVPDNQSLKPMGQTIGSQIGAATSALPGFPASSKRIYIPNGRVGVIIGKSGETIKYLQMQSGARIQVTRDMDADPNSQTRPVELIGTPDQISKAEQLINDVISEADAGGSGTISARNSTDVPAGSEHFSMRVPNNKVGLIIGKGGETIRSMQASSGARIQVIPLHLPPGDTSIERTVHIDGTKEQIESAKLLVNDVISENRVRNSATTGGYRPPRPPTSWVPSGAPPMQQPSYGYMQPGAYPGPPPQYMMSQLPYGGYPTASSGWDQSTHTAAQSIQGTGYDYYAQLQQQQQQQSVVESSAPSDGTGYSYNQMPSGYNGEASYGESAYPQSAVGNEQSSTHSVGYTQGGSQTAYAQPMYNLQASYTQHGYANAAASSQDGSAPKYVVDGSTPQTPLSGHAPTAQQPQGLIPQQPATVAQPGYVQSQGQNQPQSPAYGQGLQPLSSQAGYAQTMQVYGQPSQGYSQSSTATTGYPQDPQHVASGYGVSHPCYGQQQQQFYGGTVQSQTTGYGQQQQQHPYSTGTYDSPATAPASTNGVAKSSPQS
ncbi:hypothetical protein HPP92_002838 [Vanilla planifolia]|uniref:K Homology domain-containing protein n=1 Tax=Vanilla planifolia TaxID=51239 RepID=A0A835S620_VANPL|nr:hypothetical protein HPP92_002838 [Vanilla planifolia]